MSALRIQLFGNLELQRNGSLLPAFPTQRSRALFAFLALNRSRLHSRDVLIGTFCGDHPEPVARKLLRTSIWRIRSVLHAPAASDSCLRVQNDEIGFDRGTDYWLDVEEFESRIRASGSGPAAETTPEAAERLAQAVELYRGDLLDGIYDDWCLFERERLRLMYLGTLERLLHFHLARGEWNSAVALGQRLLGADPLREHVHRSLMRCFVLQGNRPAALRQYAACEQRLRDELDVEPMDETRALFQAISAPGGAPAGEPIAPAGPRGTIHIENLEILEQVDATLAMLHTATRQLEETRRALLTRCVDPAAARGERH